MQESYTISDGDSLTFVERVPWSHTGETETELDLLKRQMIIGKIVTVTDFYLIMWNMDPLTYGDPGQEYRIAKFTVNEDTGSVEVHSMPASAGHVAQLRKAGEWIY